MPRVSRGMWGLGRVYSVPMRQVSRSRILVLLGILLSILSWRPLAGQERTGVVRVQVAPDRDDWTYKQGAPVSFRIHVTRDGHPLPGASVAYAYGPEMLPPKVEKTAPVPKEGLVVAAGSMSEPGFLRLSATAEVDGKKYRGLATAAFAPEAIKPTVEDPPDFDAFWSAGKEALAKLPIDAKLTLLPDLSTPKVDVYHVSLQNVGVDGTGTSRFYGILAEPRGPGPFPAVMNPPGAGVRPYKGLVDLAEKGVLTLQVGIHGLPVNLDPLVYDSLRTAGLSGYQTFNLDDRDRYYYRRVYLGCLRADDFLVSHPKWDGKTLAVTGGSQGERCPSSPPPSILESRASRPTIPPSPTPRATPKGGPGAGLTCSRTRPRTGPRPSSRPFATTTS